MLNSVKPAARHFYRARHYNASWGVWLSVDPLSDKYPSHSAYNYCMNNPVMLVDPDGREVEITGDDGKITVYTPGMEYKGTDEFTKNTIEALNTLSSKEALTLNFGSNKVDIDVLGALVSDKENTVTIKHQKIDGQKNEFDPNTNTLLFNPSEGIEFRLDVKKDFISSNTGRNSPTSRLGHELIHAYNSFSNRDSYAVRQRDDSMAKDPLMFTTKGLNLSFTNGEEKYTMKLANQMNRKLGENTRTNYGGSSYKVIGVTSTTPKL